MSDSKSSYGEPVEEPRAVDDVVGSANEGIADAEAARRAAAASDESQTDAATGSAAQSAPATPVEPAPSAYDDDSTFDSALYEAHADDTATDWQPPAETVVVAASEPVAPAEAYTERYAEPAAEPRTERYAEPYAETTVVAPAATGYATPQPIFVQAPEAPRLRGNRGAAGAIGLLAALAFGVLYLALWLGVGMLDGDVTGETLGSTALTALGTWALWVPVVVFFLAFWLLGAIINRGRWGAWVIFGLLVGAAAYLGHILGALFQAPFWMLTAREGAALVEEQLLTPLAIGAFIIGRELTIWFGAWVAARGARVTELNVEAQREYERTLEAGPQLTRV
ncbi:MULTISPECIES: ABC transporter [unclassified Microbacterium]|uniref:ABC transporter n=1 Tax=unclassified Microbacterium TaxID=2609290 RepID=UPI00214A9720|nr:MULTISPECIES: ABC transporter [unclassified Microbacterium]MCR2808808.1 ABC transporter [Microbacterium sp. zg.B185]WIM18770.1 ABC transporter [Microbacterium sp. zg-B185]